MRRIPDALVDLLGQASIRNLVFTKQVVVGLVAGTLDAALLAMVRYFLVELGRQLPRLLLQNGDVGGDLLTGFQLRHGIHPQDVQQRL